MSNRSCEYCKEFEKREVLTGVADGVCNELDCVTPKDGFCEEFKMKTEEII